MLPRNVARLCLKEVRIHKSPTRIYDGIEWNPL